MNQMLNTEYWIKAKRRKQNGMILQALIDYI